MLEVLIPGTEVYGTLNEFKAFYGITDASLDVYYTGQLETASGIVSDYCGRPLCSEGVRETLRPTSGLSAIVLERWPITVTPVVTYGAGNTIVASTLYEVDVRSGVLRGLSDGQYVGFDPGVWKITYSGGFVTIPARVKEATFRLMKDITDLGKLRAGLKTRRIEGVVTESFFDADKLDNLDGYIPKNIRNLLTRYVER